MGWTEENPLKIALTGSVLTIFFAALIHFNDYSPARWADFLSWVPLIFLYHFGFVYIFFRTHKDKY